MASQLKKWIWAAVRIIVCVGALWWAFHSVRLHDSAVLKDGTIVRVESFGEHSLDIVRPEGIKAVIAPDQLAVDDDGEPRIDLGLFTVLRQSNPKWMFAALILFGPVQVFQAVRFKVLLLAQEISISTWESIKLTFTGNFLNFAALGSTGGDVAKAYGVALHTPLKTEAVTTVFLDRVIGLTGLVTTSGMLYLIAVKERGYPWLEWGIIAIIAAIVIGFGLLLSPAFRRLVKSDGWLSKYKFGRQILRIDQTTVRLVRHKNLIAIAFVLTLVLQFMALSVSTIGALAVGLDGGDGHFLQYMAYMGMGDMIAAIPIAPQGIGTTEAFYKIVLNQYGTISQILCLAMVVRIIRLLWSLPGAAFLLTGAYRPGNGDISNAAAD